ncbi:Hypothetical predicted protein [Olea europaea subsp. europaea]|uniref:Uncharacterized protein n=1 Tax=Olea europaea subsp. europaea TaxID=158383 RepID=A0A8S0RCM2_OLEEU|nr:Hypothetical predicted protein [Olea europaea subsp. europaea]
MPSLNPKRIVAGTGRLFRRANEQEPAQATPPIISVRSQPPAPVASVEPENPFKLTFGKSGQLLGHFESIKYDMPDPRFLSFNHLSSFMMEQRIEQYLRKISGSSKTAGEKIMATILVKWAKAAVGLPNSDYNQVVWFLDTPSSHAKEKASWISELDRLYPQLLPHEGNEDKLGKVLTIIASKSTLSGSMSVDVPSHPSLADLICQVYAFIRFRYAHYEAELQRHRNIDPTIFHDTPRVLPHATAPQQNALPVSPAGVGVKGLGNARR